MTDFIPLPQDDSFEKIHEHLRNKIAEMLAIPPEALTKETTRAIYEKTVQLVCEDTTIQEFVKAEGARESAANANRNKTVAAANNGNHGSPDEGTGAQRVSPRTDPITEDDGCGFSAPC